MLSEQQNQDLSQRRGRGARRRWLLITLLFLVVLVGSVFGRRLLGWSARVMAARRLDAWAISDARWWLQRADVLQGPDWRTALLRAQCHRYLDQPRHHDRAITRARDLGAPNDQLEIETTLAKIQSGELSDGAEDALPRLMEAGVRPDDIASTFVLGCLARQQMDRAETLLSTWSANYPERAHTAYLRGLFYWRGGQLERAMQSLRTAVARQPGHELAQLAIARLLDEQGKREAALARLVDLANRYPANESVLVDLAKRVRLQGRASVAATVLQPVAASPFPVSKVAVEFGEIQLELGNYEQAETSFSQVNEADSADQQVLASLGVTLSLLGKTTRAQRAFQWNDFTKDAVIQMHDLQGRLKLDPNDRVAREAMRRFMQELSRRPKNVNPMQLETPAEEAVKQANVAGLDTYLNACSACHGIEGNGDGRAARFLWPRPRDLRRGKTRLISTRNGNPTLDDIKRVLRNGIPGTAMPANDSLTDRQLQLLAEIVVRMRATGIREQFTTWLHANDEIVDPEEVEQTVVARTTPGVLVARPTFPPNTPAADARGKQIYARQGCASCHGETGTGDDENPLFDDKGRPTWPRDLVHDEFKGGNTPESIYLRILLGMPGTPHPSSVSLTDDQIRDLVQYCRTLGKTPKRVMTNHMRFLRATTRPVLESVP